MYTFDTSAHARALVDQRLREASRARLAREFQPSERPTTGPTTGHTTVPEPRRHSLLWSIVHLRHAYS